MNLIEERKKRTQWFLESRFGMFVHWGLYAIPARGEWIMTNERMTKEEYRVYFDEFNPSNYDPRAWARAAREAGTPKHLSYPLPDKVNTVIELELK